MPFRFVLPGLSAGGMCAAAVLWATSHPTLATQVLAGDILLIFVIVLAL